MPTPFDNLTLDQLKQALAAKTPECIAVNVRYADGDHWQHGAQWVGPQPPAGDPAAALVLLEIRRAFVSKNAIKEVVGRHVAGVVGREPAWGITVKRPLKEKQKPTQAEQKLIDEAEAALTTWWDQRGLLKLLQQAAATLLLSGRSSLRLFVPPGQLREDGTVPAADLPTSLGRIYAHHPAPGQALIITDTRTQQQCSVYVYEQSEQTIDALAERGTMQTYAELSYLDGEETVLRIIGGAAPQETRLNLGGLLLLHEAERPILITEQVRANQNQLNLSKTMQGRNVVQGGFLERIVLNGQLPGDWVDDASAPSGKRFVPKPFKVGAGTTNFISGVPIRDQDGKITDYTDPSVVYRDPVKIDTFQGTGLDAYRAILEEVQQLHALIAGDATASGESRKQARADFEQSLLMTKSEIDHLVRWLLETALTLAAIFSGQPERFAALRVTCDCRLDTGPLASDEQGQIIDQVDAELISRETAMSRIGVEDVDAEKARIAEEKAARAALAPATTTQPNDPAANSQPATDPQLPSGQPTGKDAQKVPANQG